MTNAQLQLIHVAQRQLGLDDARYRILLKNVAGAASSKDLANDQFEDVMATMESMGFGTKTNGLGYFQNKVALRGTRANERQLHLLRELLAKSRYSAEGLCLRQSDGRTDHLEQLTPREAWLMIEMLKKSNAREDEKQGRAAQPQPTLFGT